MAERLELHCIDNGLEYPLDDREFAPPDLLLENLMPQEIVEIVSDRDRLVEDGYVIGLKSIESGFIHLGHHIMNDLVDLGLLKEIEIGNENN